MSEYSSPVLIIPKPNGKGYRFVVDLRAINDRTKRINYYMPDIQGMFEKLKGAAYISCLDLQKGYWQAPLDPAAQASSGSQRVPSSRVFVPVRVNEVRGLLASVS